MKTYKTKAALVRKINQTIIRQVEYEIMMVNGHSYTAKFKCLSDLEKRWVVKEGFELV